jgi:caffeoyl-CoA O-methyltransferase
MSDDVYETVDSYLDELFGGEDPALQRAIERSAAAGLPSIQVSSTHGRFLHVLALTCGARSVLEIGTLGGYSTIWLAGALPPDGKVVSLEVEPDFAAVARANVDEAGVGDRVEIRVGRALESLDELQRAGDGPFDLVFIDADKAPYAEYFKAVLGLSRPGTLIVADNVIRRGAVTDASSTDEAVVGIRRFNAALAAEARVTATIVQQVGVKGHDGMALAVVR